MEYILGLVKSVVLLFILVAIVMTIVGESELNQYIKFFSGMLVLLICISGVSQKLDEETVSSRLKIREWYEEYKQRNSFESILNSSQKKQYSIAEELLIEGFNDALAEKDYRIVQFESIMGENGKLKRLILYLADNNRESPPLGTLERDSRQAEECREILTSGWEPDFDLVIYGKKDGSNE